MESSVNTSVISLFKPNQFFSVDMGRCYVMTEKTKKQSEDRQTYSCSCADPVLLL